MSVIHKDIHICDMCRRELPAKSLWEPFKGEVIGSRYNQDGEGISIRKQFCSSCFEIFHAQWRVWFNEAIEKPRRTA